MSMNLEVVQSSSKFAFLGITPSRRSRTLILLVHFSILVVCTVTVSYHSFVLANGVDSHSLAPYDKVDNYRYIRHIA